MASERGLIIGGGGSTPTSALFADGKAFSFLLCCFNVEWMGGPLMEKMAPFLVMLVNSETQIT